MSVFQKILSLKAFTSKKNLKSFDVKNLKTSFASAWHCFKTSASYDQLAKQGYVKNVIAYRSIQLIARGLASIPWLLYTKNHELENHPLLNLLKTPNLKQADSSFREELVSHLLINGNAYILKTLSDNNLPLELHLLRPDRMTILKGDSSIPYGYVYEMGNKKYTFPLDPLTGQCQILHIKFFNPLDDWYGMAPLQAALKAIDQHNAVGDHNLALLQNGGRPSGAFVVKPSEYGSVLSDRQRESLSKDLKEAYEGASNAGRVLFLEGDFEWKEMGLNLKDLDYIDGKNLSSREIAQAFGVPPMLVGVPGDATFANYKEARYHLWEDTILPLIDLIVGELNKWLCPHFNQALHIAYDADRIPALSLRRESSWAKIAEVSFLTINEKRHAVGYGDHKDGDKLCIA
ncbi:MAG: phage portal protein [Proteobacteria bacterium]|nr:phage portal protein [Pseudomonadota bacterium]